MEQTDAKILGFVDHIAVDLHDAVGDTDDLIQGLKRHWLLRSAFKKKATNAPAIKK